MRFVSLWLVAQTIVFQVSKKHYISYNSFTYEYLQLQLHLLVHLAGLREFAVHPVPARQQCTAHKASHISLLPSR